MTSSHNLFQPGVPGPGQRMDWPPLAGSSGALGVARLAERAAGPILVIAPDIASANRWEQELAFFQCDEQTAVVNFPDWETLPYDVFSPHQDIISGRLAALYQLPRMDRGVVVVAATTLMHRLPPRRYLEAHSLRLGVGDRLDLDGARRRLESAGYRNVPQVNEHGEFAVRGALLDLFPMGSNTPFRIELFDDDVDSLRTFDPETQRSTGEVHSIDLLPARETPLDDEGIAAFRHGFRARFEGDPQNSPVYREVSAGNPPPGVEYYLPLFFDQTEALFDYLPETATVLYEQEVHQAAEQFWREIGDRYEQLRYNRERPLLPPTEGFLQPHELFGALKGWPRIELGAERAPGEGYYAEPLPDLAAGASTREPLKPLLSWIEDYEGRALVVAETPGRRETLLDLLARAQHPPEVVDDWQTFLGCESALCLTTAPLERGMMLDDPRIAVIPEAALFGGQVAQHRRRRKSDHDGGEVIRHLAELHEGAPVVHREQGVGRYVGLTRLESNGVEQEFLTLEYAGRDRLYVPVSSLHLVTRYTGASPEAAPLHRLGSEQWDKAKRRASKRVRDVAAELLDLYARRAAAKGRAHPAPDNEFRAFAASFPFEETPDQQEAIERVLADMQRSQPMDRLVCGDVGFGKTEVAMRAAFLAVQGGSQVVVLVPTTLLAEQHYQTFADRMADWPIRIETISRLKSTKEQQKVLKEAQAGHVDILIGTHRLLNKDVRFANLGLVIIDEEHRFGVRHKEKLKALRAEVDVLTMTATPIPRTLNLAMSGLRELSMIATPPARRLAIKTFVREWDTALIREACLREIRRGGQLYFVHNEVQTIEETARKVAEAVPEARVRVSHGQMRERELEKVMQDFYHHRFNVLVCTTIIESGIDIPNANTILINRADRLGMAQLHQLRGRVGRSHHRAYAYLLAPAGKSLTRDARKRLEAIEDTEDLGAGFTLASHDLEIRGAGELLGEEQSGQIQEIGFSLYAELLERAVAALKAGEEPPELDDMSHGETEVDLGVPALLPEDYMPDVHTRLVFYKRIASAESVEALRALQVELVDRFGLLPEAARMLFRVTEIKLRAAALGIKKLEVGHQGGRVRFEDEPRVDPERIVTLLQEKPATYKLGGPNALRVTITAEEPEERIDHVMALLDELSEAEAA